MGAWGYGSFENDSALDWLHEVVEAEPALVGAALDGVATADDQVYLEVDECSAALAAAELVAAALGRGDDRLNDDAAAWLRDHRDEIRGVGAARARRAVERVVQGSELRELWDENGADTEWHAGVRELLKRLSD
ncbi:DUF4259 domain-containing protein [Sorangium sp. So ce216]